MNKKPLWIWHYGEYENYHMTKVNLRRQEHGLDYPAFWKISPAHVSIEFKKEFECDTEKYMLVHINGKGFVYLDDIKYAPGKKIAIAPGKHCVKVDIFNTDGLPAIFVESDACPSGEDWTANHRAGKHVPVGFNECFDSPDKNPEVFPFEYENRKPISAEIMQGGVLYDFGEELFGFLNIKNADADKTMGVFYGESREEALDGEEAILFEYVSGSCEYRLRRRAFRYIFISCENPSELQVDMDYEYLVLEKKGDFKCDNDIFNKIYDVSVRTFHLNCREAFLDGIKRDGWVWSGDAYQSGRINAYLFADEDIVRRTALGLIGHLPIEQHINTIVDYSLLWIIGLYEYYMTYGDVDFLRRIYPLTRSLMDFCEKRINSDGFLEGIDDDWTFVDWSDIDKTGAVCAEQMLLIKTYKTMAELCELLGEESNDYLAKSDRLTKRVNEYYWKPELGAFIDSYESGKNNVTRHANIFAIMYDIATPEQVEAIIENVLKNDDIIKITTPYFKGYEMDVWGKLGEYAAVEDMIDSYWGQMLRDGAGTIWEEYDPTLSGVEHYAMYGEKYGKSLCHAWGAGAVYMFGRYYMGVYPTAPGYAKYNVEPNLGGLGSFSGVVPINGGSVKIEMSKNKLTVLSDKPGGTLVFGGKAYEIKPDEEIRIEY